MAGKSGKDVKLSKTVPTASANPDTNHDCDKCGKDVFERQLLVVKTLRADGAKATNFYHRDCMKY